MNAKIKKLYEEDVDILSREEITKKLKSIYTETSDSMKV